LAVALQQRNAELWLAQQSATEARIVSVSRIQANQAHLLHIINDILDLTRIECGHIAMISQPVPLQDALTAVEPLVAERGLHYHVDPDIADLVATGQVERLTQVLVNLVANAIRCTEPGGNITIGATSDQERVRIHVTDSGIGIPHDKHERVFQPFVQVDSGPSRRMEGTGLGLAISRRLLGSDGWDVERRQ